MAHVAAQKLAELELTCLHAILYITHKKNALAILHPLLFQIISFAWLTIVEAFKGTIYIALQSLFLQFSSFNEWKFMQKKTSNNSSNQSGLNKRSLLSLALFVQAKKNIFTE